MTNRLLTPLACLLMLSIAAFCQAVPNDNFADEKTRNIVGGRKVLITVTQNAIEPRIDYYLPNRPVTASELYDIRQLTMLAAQESVPLVQALVGYEFTAPLEAALRPTVEKSAWLRPQDVEFSEHGTQDFVLDKLDEANTRQMLLLYTNYHTDPKFAAVIVELKISLLVRKIPKGQYRAGRLKPKYIPYEQIIRSVVRLPDLDSRNLFKLPEAEAQDRRNNVERWAANDGLLARRALHAGIAAVSAMVPISIELDEQQAKEWRSRGDRKTQKVEGVFGWVRERDSKGILMIDARDGAWTRIQIATDLPPSPNSSRDTVLRPQ